MVHQFYISFLLVVYILLSLPLSGQDTLLVDFRFFSGSIDKISDDGKGNMYLSSGIGIYRFDGDKIKWLKNNESQRLYIFRDGSLKSYAIQDLVNLNLFPREKEVAKKWEKFLPIGSAQRISTAHDKQGRIWIAKGQHLFCFEINQRFKLTYREKSIRGILPLGDKLLVGSYAGIFWGDQQVLPDSIVSNGHFFRWNKQEILIPNNQLIAYRLSDSTYNSIPFEKYKNDQPNIVELALFRETLYAATTSGLFQLKGEKLTETRFRLPIEDIYLYQKQIFLATPAGIFSGTGANFSPFRVFPSIPFNSIQRIGNTWWATSQRGIWTWQEGQAKAVQLFENQEIAHLVTYDLVQDNSGYIWVSSISGIIRFKPHSKRYERFLTQIEFNKRAVAQHGDSIYFGSMNGLFSFHPSQFKEPPAETVFLHLPYWLVGLLLGILLVSAGLIIFIYAKYRRVTRLLTLKINEQPLIQDPFLQELETFIQTNIQHVTVDSLVAFTGLSRRRLYDIFENKYAMNPGDLIRNIKLKRIQEIIQENPSITYEALGEQVGYSPSYLARYWKGLTT